MHELFKRQNLGRNSFQCIVKEVYEEEWIKGSGVKDGITTHGLRGTVATMLLEAGHADSSIAMRTRHRDLRSLKNYQNLEGAMGMKQQEHIFKFGHEIQEKRRLEDKLKYVRAVGTKKGRVQAELLPNYDADNKENKDDEGNVTEKEKDSTGSTEGILRLLNGVSSISGGTFSINVHNYR